MTTLELRQLLWLATRNADAKARVLAARNLTRLGYITQHSGMGAEDGPYDLTPRGEVYVRQLVESLVDMPPGEPVDDAAAQTHAAIRKPANQAEPTKKNGWLCVERNPIPTWIIDDSELQKRGIVRDRLEMLSPNGWCSDMRQLTACVRMDDKDGVFKWEYVVRDQEGNPVEKWVIYND